MANPAEKSLNYSANPKQLERIEMVLPRECAGMRLDQALSRLLPDFSRSRLQQWVRAGEVTLDGAPAAPKSKVRGGEKIALTPRPDPAAGGFSAQDIPLDIVYEDDALLVVNKPAGLVTHPGSGNWQGTLLNALLHHAPQLAALPRAGIVHRLDKDTSGLLAVAKTLTAQTALVRQLQARSVKREYLALAWGDVPPQGVVEAPIGRHPVQRVKMAVAARGKPAVTHFRMLERLDGISLVRCSLETGRTHQIRVHMQSIGCPLVGDAVYGRPPAHQPDAVREALRGFRRQALHAQRLELDHPHSGARMAWEAPLPPDMQRLLEALRRAR